MPSVRTENEKGFRILKEPPTTAYKDEPVLLFAVGLDPALLSSGYDSEQIEKISFHWLIDDGPDDFDLEDVNTDLKQNLSAKTTLPTKDLITGEYVVRVQASTNRDSNDVSEDDPTATISINVERSIEAQVHEKVIADGLSIETKQPEPTPDQGFWVKLRQCVGGPSR